jgi:hypothetical protein
MLYEGRLLGPGGGAPDPNEGRIGIARSSDEGQTWTVDAQPIVVPSGLPWSQRAVVPDDLIHVGGTWVLLGHGQDVDGAWTVGRFATTDEPSQWGPGSFTERPGNPLTQSSETVMVWGNDPSRAMMVTGDGRSLQPVAVTAR